MIFDQENIFLDNVEGNTITTSGVASTVLANVGGGDAEDPLFLVIAAPVALTGGPFTAELQTSDSEDFGTKDTLATYSIQADVQGILVKSKMPYGAKKFLRLFLKGTGAGTGGKITAALTETVPNWP